jgi:hypothetical protein
MTTSCVVIIIVAIITIISYDIISNHAILIMAIVEKMVGTQV